ncbi:MAG: DUF2911 domain-containing protein [Gemmatimonadota bacterium]
MRRLLFALALAPLTAGAQTGSVVYTLGRDTVAVEKYSRTPAGFSGEMVTRTGAAVTRTSYQLTLANGVLTSATVRRSQADGSPLPNVPAEYRFSFRPDSTFRQTVWPDSTARHSWAVGNAFVTLPVYVYAPYSLLAGRTRRDSIPAVGLGGTNVGMLGFTGAGGDTLRLRGAPYAMLIRYASDGRLLSLDGSHTTNKVIGLPGTPDPDIAAIARGMRPTGVLSPRVTAQASITQAPIMINHGSPAVRGRTVWGGTLVPFDSVWRAGANEATHLAASRTLQIGDLTVPAGLYTIWILHTRSGTSLVINRQTGQWGTAYNAANDLGRVPMQLTPAPSHVEDLTVTIRPMGGPRGAIEFAWGDRVASVPFTVRN